MPGFTSKFVNDAGVELEVDGSYRFAEHDEIEIVDYKAWRLVDANDPSAPFVSLSDDEDARLYEELCADPNTWEYDYD